MKQSIFNFDSGDNIFLTSDSHFFHKNIIELCNRPFSSVEEMNEKLIENWNSVVSPNDYIFHLGDFCFGGSAAWDYCLDRLNGHKFLILGNHEWKNMQNTVMYKFDWVGQQAYITVGKRKIYLNHFPFLCYGGAYRSGEDAVLQAFGHIHSNPYNMSGKDASRMQYLFPTQYDVGIDNNNYTPISYNQFIDIINKQISKYEEKVLDN